MTRKFRCIRLRSHGCERVGVSDVPKGKREELPVIELRADREQLGSAMKEKLQMLDFCDNAVSSHSATDYIKPDVLGAREGIVLMAGTAKTAGNTNWKQNTTLTMVLLFCSPKIIYSSVTKIFLKQTTTDNCLLRLQPATPTSRLQPCLSGVAAWAAGCDTYCSEQGPQLETGSDLHRKEKKMKYSRRLQIHGAPASRFIGTSTHILTHTHLRALINNRLNNIFFYGDALNLEVGRELYCYMYLLLLNTF